MPNRKKTRISFKKWSLRIKVLQQTAIFAVRNRIKYKSFKRWSYISTSGLIGVTLTLALTFIHFRSFLEISLPQDPAAFFITAGSMCGAMLAIVFAFSMALSSRSADTLPATLYSLFSKDKLLDLIYFLISTLTLALFASSFLTKNSHGQIETLYFRLGLIIIVWALILIYWAYRRLTKILSHQFLIGALANKVVREINELKFLAQHQAEIAWLKNGANNTSIRLTAESHVYRQLGRRVEGLLVYVSDLTSLFFKYSARGDPNAANDCSTAAIATVIAYIQSRTTNSTLVLNPAYPTSPESELSPFIHKAVDIISPIWIHELEKNNLDGIRVFLTSYMGVVISASSVKHIVGKNENPAFTSAYFVLSRFISKSIELKNAEATFQAAGILEQLGREFATSPQSSYVDNISLILDDLMKIYKSALLEKDYTVASTALKSLLNIARYVLMQEVVGQHRYEQLKKCLIEALKLHTLLGNVSDFQANFQVILFADELLPVATNNFGAVLTPPQAQKMLQIADLSISIIQSLLPLSSNPGSSGLSFGRTITLLAKKLLSFTELTPQQVSEYANVWQRFAQLAKGIPLETRKVDETDDYEELVNHLYRAALLAIESGKPEYAEAISSVVITRLHSLLKKGSNLYAIIRLSNDTKYIGAFAFNRGYSNLADTIAQSIRELEVDYRAKTFPTGYDPTVNYSHSPDAFRTSPHDYRNGFYSTGLPDYFENIDDLAIRLITINDLISYEQYIWSTSP